MRMFVKRISIFFCCCFCSVSLFAQIEVEEIAQMPMEVQETSGLIFYQGDLITHNDSGNEAILYVIDSLTAVVKRQISITNAVNIDWEAITQDELYVYIGDFGNNNGTRTDLVIYRISKDDMAFSDTVTAETLSFSYEDQQSFENTGPSDWDAETFFVYDNSLIILTKQWQSAGTDVYKIPKIPGEYIAQKIENYHLNGLVCDATINKDTLYLVGYSNFLLPIIWEVSGIENNSFFGGNIIRHMPEIGFTQFEAITFNGVNTFFISSEAYENVEHSILSESRLFKFVVNDEDDDGGDDGGDDSGGNDEDEGDGTSGGDDGGDANDGSDGDGNNGDGNNGDDGNSGDGGVGSDELSENVVIYQEYGTSFVNFEIDQSKKLRGTAIFDLSGKQLDMSELNFTETSFNMAMHSASIYILVFYFENEIVSKPFIFSSFYR